MQLWHWMGILVIILIPLIQIPTLRDTVAISVLGTMAALVCDVVAMEQTWTRVPFNVRYTEVRMDHIVQMFGNLSFAYGTASLVPSIQRQHKTPSRMPYVITVALTIVTSMYACIGLLTYTQFGCTAPHNLLQAVPVGWGRKVAYGGMFIHVLIAYYITVHPAIFLLERWYFQNDIDDDVEQNALYVSESSRLSLLEKEQDSEHGKSTVLASQPSVYQRIVLRSAVVIGQGLLALVLHSSLQDLLNLIGATCVTLSCLILPCYFYLKVFEYSISKWERILCQTVLVLGITLGLYSTCR